MAKPSTTEVRRPPSGTSLFISDLHLTPEAAQLSARFEQFLAGPARAADALYILGDLFDFWAGDDDLDAPFNARIVGALARLSAQGVAVFFLPGNRDFLAGDDFAAAAGLHLLPDPCVREFCGMPILLTHGDMLCTDDNDYQEFRAEVRTPSWRTAFLAQPLDARKTAIATLRNTSESEKKRKAMTIMDVNPDAVAAALRQHGAQAMIHGHTHRQGQRTHDVDGNTCLRWVLGDWDGNRSSALACTPTGWQFLKLGDI